MGKVDAQPERPLYHVRDDSVEEWAGAIQDRVSVDFDQPGLELPVNHKVKSKYFEVVLVVVWGNFGEHTPGSVRSHLFHLGHYLLFEIIFLLG